MSPHALKLGESLEAYETRLKLQHEVRQRNIIMELPEHEYRRRKAELTAPPRLHVPSIPDCRGLSDEDYAAAKRKAGIFTASLR